MSVADSKEIRPKSLYSCTLASRSGKIINSLGIDLYEIPKFPLTFIFLLNIWKEIEMNESVVYCYVQLSTEKG